MYELKNLPPQQLSYKSKDKKWRQKHLDWADKKSFYHDEFTRKSVLHKKINYDLLDGILHMNDMEAVLNPDHIDAAFVPDQIQHYPIMNSKLLVLKGEEYKRKFDYRVIVTNPNAISEREETKKNELFEEMKAIIEDTSLDEEEFNQKLEELNEYYSYNYQDFREIRANALLKHFYKELNLPIKFNAGFMDAAAVGEEIYQVEIVSGEPVVERINPLKIRIFRNGYSNKVEDADMIVLEDFWSPGKIIDYFYDSLTEKDMKYIEKIPFAATEGSDPVGLDERAGFLFAPDECNEPYGQGILPDSSQFFGGGGVANRSLYYDLAGNIKVLRVYWKSRRKIKKVTSYDERGEKVVNFETEDYEISEELGEEEQILWINEAWGGTKIGRDIYVDMGPLPVQFNRISNPSRCHFGIIGNLYNLNEAKPFSMVDMMKPFNYMYDAIQDRLIKAIAANWGTIYEMDLASIPADWEIDKWVYYARVNHIAVKNSFNEGNKGAAKGKLSGAFAGNTRGIINADTGNYIQQLINILEYLKSEMGEIVGVSRQREGQISNRETVGGVERATLQSSHITEWLFSQHDDLKKRVLEALLEVSKVCLRGRTIKFSYILSDHSTAIAEIDGDEFAEADYGLLVDDSSQELAQKLEGLAQVALQSQTLSFSTIMKIYSSSSLAEIQKEIEKDEAAMMQRQSEAQQQSMQIQQEQAQLQAQAKQAELEQKEAANIRDNETKILVAQIQGASKAEDEDGITDPNVPTQDMVEKIRQFNEKMKLDREKLALEKQKHKDDVVLKNKALNKPKASSQK